MNLSVGSVSSLVNNLELHMADNICGTVMEMESSRTCPWPRGSL